MKQRLVRRLLRLAGVLTLGTLAQATCTGGVDSSGVSNAYMTLPRLGAEGALTSIDFCYIFDCQGGFFGGAVQPCGDPTTTADDIFVDCPGFTGGGTTTP